MSADMLDEVYEVILDRKNNPKQGSYVASLYNDPKGLDRVLEKIGEESTELVIAAKNGGEKEIIGESADLFFHVMILLAAKDIPLDKIRAEFEKRRR
jgi:phosphoribosyl-ATP pyrophosphohydrolase